VAASQPSVSVVVPVFNGAASLHHLVDRLSTVLEVLGCPHETILVNDASTDESWTTIETLVTARPGVRGVNLSRNFGQHNALLAGIRIARYDVIVTMDDDLQHPPEEIPKLLQQLEHGFDVVYGTQQSDVHGLLRTTASRLTRVALRQFMAADSARHVSAFRAFRGWVRSAFSEYNAPMVNIDVMLTWATSQFSHVEVRQDRRKHGKSNYSVDLLVTHAWNMITGYSIRPLQLASLIGFVFMLFGLCVLVLLFVNFLVRGGGVPGFTFISCLVAVFAGIQLFALGIIGEYLARTHMRIMGRPSFVVRELKSSDEPGNATP
jgi:undecaprenyl-phosphate 4-deoxy-4-formamido-L-arabinose transferase